MTRAVRRSELAINPGKPSAESLWLELDLKVSGGVGDSFSVSSAGLERGLAAINEDG